MPFTPLSDRAKPIAVIAPAALTTVTSATGYIDMGAYERIAAIVQLGALGASNTVDAKIQQAKDTSGTGLKDVTNAAITQLSKANTNDNGLAVINVEATALDTNNSFRYARLLLTFTGTNTGIAGAVVLGDPENTNVANVSSLIQVVSV